MPVFEGVIKSYGEWVSETATNSLGGFASGSEDWGVLSWEQSLPDSDAEVKVDILKASDDSLLVSDLTWLSGGIHLENYSSVGTNDIKLRFKLWWVEKSPEVSNVNLTFEQMA